MIKYIISATALCHYLFVTLIWMKLASSSETRNKKLNQFYRRKKNKLIQMGKFAVEKNNRISTYKGILQQKPTFFHIDSLKGSAENNENINFYQTARSKVLNGFWQWAKIIHMTPHFPIIFWWWDRWAVEKLVLYKV